MALFVFGVNVFAWFVFVSRANVTINGNVSAWDVNFADSNEIITDIVIEDVNLYPGMPTYTKEIFVNNSSSVEGIFEYSINSIKVLGDEVISPNTSREDAINYLGETFPFIVTFDISKDILNAEDSLTFTIKIDWPLDKGDTFSRDYYRLTNHYRYDPSVSYYVLMGDTYEKKDSLSEAEFNAGKTGYYLEKDDADSFWGSTCKSYYDENNESCFQFKLFLKVSQKAK